MIDIQRPTIVEPWHPDLLSKKFFEELFKSNMNGNRFIEINPTDVRGLNGGTSKPPFNVGEIIKTRKTNSEFGVILETYLVEKWNIQSINDPIKARPYSYDLMCVIKWANKNIFKLDKKQETQIVPFGTIQSASSEIQSLKLKIESSQRKLALMEADVKPLMEFYSEFSKSNNLLMPA